MHRLDVICYNNFFQTNPERRYLTIWETNFNFTALVTRSIQTNSVTISASDTLHWCHWQNNSHRDCFNPTWQDRQLRGGVKATGKGNLEIWRKQSRVLCIYVVSRSQTTISEKDDSRSTSIVVFTVALTVFPLSLQTFTTTLKRQLWVWKMAIYSKRLNSRLLASLASRYGMAALFYL
jgi:hypothetical protein